MSSLSLLFGRHRIQRSRVNILLAPLNTDVRVLMSAASITANMRPRTPVRKDHFQLRPPKLFTLIMYYREFGLLVQSSYCPNVDEQQNVISVSWEDAQLCGRGTTTFTFLPPQFLFIC